jgi:hypothetical protein
LTLDQEVGFESLPRSFRKAPETALSCFPTRNDVVAVSIVLGLEWRATRLALPLTQSLRTPLSISARSSRLGFALSIL